MQVPDGDLGLEVEQPPEPVQDLLEVLDRLQPLQIADVLADQAPVAMGQGQRVLEVGADREERHAASPPAAPTGQARSRARGGEESASRPRPARPSRRSGSRSPGRGAGTRRRCRRAGRRASAMPMAIGSSLRVPAGHHQRSRGQVEQQMVQRSVGQHARRPCRAPARARAPACRYAPAQQHHRSLRRTQKRRFLLVHLRQRPRLRQGPYHDRERLRLALLSPAQLAPRRPRAWHPRRDGTRRVRGARARRPRRSTGAAASSAALP